MTLRWMLFSSAIEARPTWRKHHAKRGDRVFYYPLTKTILAGEAAEQASADFEAASFDEDFR